MNRKRIPGDENFDLYVEDSGNIYIRIKLGKAKSRMISSKTKSLEVARNLRDYYRAQHGLSNANAG